MSWLVKKGDEIDSGETARVQVWAGTQQTKSLVGYFNFKSFMKEDYYV